MEFHLSPADRVPSPPPAYPYHHHQPPPQPPPPQHIRLPSISQLLSHYPLPNTPATRAFSKWSHEQTAQLVDYFRRPGTFIQFQNSKKNDFYANIVKLNVVPGKDARQIKNKFEHLTRKYEEMDAYIKEHALEGIELEAYSNSWPFFRKMYDFMQLDDKRHKRKRHEDVVAEMKKQKTQEEQRLQQQD